MTEVYYIQNDKQYKHVVLRLCEQYEVQDDMTKFNICGCDYTECEECQSCDEDICLLLEHSSDKDVLSHIYTYEIEEFPCILVVADTHYEDESFTIIPVSEAKLNTKYGINGGW